MQSTKRVLLIVSSRIGDVIFTTPALELLKRARPEFIITVLAPSTYSAEVLKNNPAVDRILIKPDKVLLNKMVQEFDTVVALHDSADCRTYFSCFDQILINKRPLKFRVHWLDYYVSFIQETFAITESPIAHYQLFPDRSDYQRIQQIYKQHGIEAQESVIGIHMGCRHVAKRGQNFIKNLFLSNKNTKSWSFSKFTDLADQLVHELTRVRFVLIGTPSEKKLSRYFKKHAERTINLIGQTNVLELAALMKSLDVLVIGDTGPLHVACAMDTPLVSLFGPTFPEHSGPRPGGDQQIVLKEKNMDLISVSVVKEAVLSLIKKKYFVPAFPWEKRRLRSKNVAIDNYLSGNGIMN